MRLTCPNADQTQKLFNLLGFSILIELRVTQCERDVVEYRATGHQIEVLKDHADAAAHDAQICVGKRREVRAVDDNIARGRPL